MNEAGLQALLERVTADVTAEVDVAEVAWERARRQSRRTTLAAAVVAAAGAVVVATLLNAPPTGDRTGEPINHPPATQPSTVHSSIPSYLPRGPVPHYRGRLQAVMQPAWQDEQIDVLPRLETTLPPQLQPFAATVTTTVAQDPVDRAVAVAQRRSGRAIDIRVLGEDRRWRILDTSSLRPSFSDGQVVSLIGGSPLSPDGTRLALPQPDSVVIFNLTTGTPDRIRIPRDREPSWMPRSVQWNPDGTDLIVGSSAGTAGSSLVHVADGSVEEMPFNASVSAFAPDGAVVVMRDGGCGFCELVRYERGVVMSDVLLGVGLYVQHPGAGDGVVAVARAVRSWSGPRSDLINSDGILVVAAADGEPVGFLPMRSPHQAENSELVGWLDDNTLLIHVFVPTLPWARDALIAWNYKSGQLWTLTDPWKWTDDFEIAFAVGQL